MVTSWRTTSAMRNRSRCGLDGVAGRRLPGLAAHANDLGDAIDALAHLAGSLPLGFRLRTVADRRPSSALRPRHEHGTQPLVDLIGPDRFPRRDARGRPLRSGEAAARSPGDRRPTVAGPSPAGRRRAGPAVRRRRHNGRRAPVLAPAGALGGDERVAAADEPLGREVLGFDLGQALLVKLGAPALVENAGGEPAPHEGTLAANMLVGHG